MGAPPTCPVVPSTNLIRLSGINSCNSLPSIVILITLSDSILTGKSRANGLPSCRQRSQNFRLPLYGGLEIITSQCSGSYVKKSCPSSMWLCTTLKPLRRSTCTNSLCALSNGHQMILFFRCWMCGKRISTPCAGVYFSSPPPPRVVVYGVICHFLKNKIKSKVYDYKYLL